MRDMAKIALGVFVGLLACAILGFAVIVWFAPTQYDECWVRCVTEWEEIYLPITTSGEEYAEIIIEAQDITCPNECEPYHRQGFDLVIEVLGRISHRLAP